MKRYNELKKLARQATPGPWIVATPNTPTQLDSMVYGAIGGTPFVVTDDHYTAQYVGAVSPEVVLELLGRLCDTVELLRRVHDTDCIRGEDEGLHDEVTVLLSGL